ncbi:WbqC family protein [Kiritimatiella glycovorans]|uniref:WbqC-like protein family protein n=1 Tax=Kiritimatiella glycovorans TaxID=1307763 RepID=A0A0G3EC75_9BACT|nr:WbqC family protein [Kiritimatiella glycovorans]AKJ63888.1 hypothetical protein L21SP4_00619 [Kiritimatiella glycovorans]
MRCAIHQPQFMPWLGYLNKIALADVFVFLDHVQFKKNEYQNRNRIRTPGGWMWLTVPVRFHFGDPIHDVQPAAGEPWRRKVLTAISTSYGKAPYYREYRDSLHELIDRPWRDLAQLNEATVRWLCDAFGLETAFETASALPQTRREPTRRLIDLCRHLGCDTYLSGKDGPHYMDTGAFDEEGLDLHLQHFEHPAYPQVVAGAEQEFEPCMSALDLLFNAGPERGRELIVGSGTAKPYRKEAAYESAGHRGSS